MFRDSAVWPVSLATGWNQPQQLMKNKTKSKKQVGYLLSKGSPLSQAQQSKLKKELHSGKVKVRKK